MSDTESSHGIPEEVAATTHLTTHQPNQPPDCNDACPPSPPGVFSDDEHSGELSIDRDYTGVFEGPEKTLEVCFRKVGQEENISTVGEVSLDQVAAEAGDTGTRKMGLRQLGRTDLDRICARARCTILSSVSNQYLDAYVLSESSLFIYPYLLVLKTCGTTTLLRCIGTLIELGRKLGLEIDWVGYSRKNFNFPGDQAFPHQSFHQELDYLYSHKSLCERLDGDGYTLGPVTDDHWFVFVADQTIRAGGEMDTDRVLNIMMFDIDVNVAKLFYYDAYDAKSGESKDDETKRISKEQTSASGIDKLCPGSLIDARAFEPCGYSMNAILFRSYSTMHITPESGSSYASFETNQKLTSYKSLISNVVRTFRPKRFVMTLMADEGGMKQMKENPMDDAKIAVPKGVAANGAKTDAVFYKRSSLASIQVEDDCCCLMANWVMDHRRAAKNAGAAPQHNRLPSETQIITTRGRGMSVS
ncbi:S-adenosylmethionine decarboxylase proenzyme [Seminavis robusta]|uniref:adenosylmethionine decarboxylase n=1 Tax=Seminavis robusta TaxID=568900 RepID=A0A9N8HGI4_9STRA|nr:S-adenosylmethionine decarboxylase proenzyme [Seminavis robusta]|eukprot:Sro399_g134830.1 S-adenosylmethionine decarboxylase proenzyme (472) ;mRNA; r:14715-16130